ncbi:hypothetical protein [Providencia manganoxydans]|uniref:hypothetical protein n=1 Tax=Providencia manganoxydans TaxID=2923283 RepID=UPI0032D9B077
MRKKFIVALNSTTEEQQKNFIELIRKKGLSWWHWLDGTWLIVDSSGELTATELRDECKIAFPSVHLLVIEINANEDTWSGFGPSDDDNNNMFRWIHDTWDKSLK